MDAASIKADLRECTGGKAWISKRKLRGWLGMGDAKAAVFEEGLKSRRIGNRIEFFIGDVAEKVMCDIEGREFNG